MRTRILIAVQVIASAGAVALSRLDNAGFAVTSEPLMNLVGIVVLPLALLSSCIAPLGVLYVTSADQLPTRSVIAATVASWPLTLLTSYGLLPTVQ